MAVGVNLRQRLYTPCNYPQERGRKGLFFRSVRFHVLNDKEHYTCQMIYARIIACFLFAKYYSASFREVNVVNIALYEFEAFLGHSVA